jgi:hypothetical protein
MLTACVRRDDWLAERGVDKIGYTTHWSTCRIVARIIVGFL